MRTSLTIVLALALTAATVRGDEGPTDAQVKPSTEPSVAQGREQARGAEPVANLRIEITMTEAGERGTAPPKTVSLVVVNGEAGRMRSSAGPLVLNVDARPEITRDGRIKLFLNLEYRPSADTEKTAVTLTQSLAALLDDGRPLTVSQSADPGSSRAVKVELKATILK